MKNPIDVPYRYGLEYEIQVVVKHPDLKGITTVTLYESTKQRMKDVSGLINAKVFSKGSNWLLARITSKNKNLSNIYALYVTKALFKGIATIDVGNIEIVNEKPHQTLPAAIKELNEKVDEVGKIFQELFKDHFQFAFFLPVLQVHPKYSEVDNTKHLNTTYNVTKSRAKRVNELERYMKLLIEDYPHYFDEDTFTVMIKMDKNLIRLHIKLPYTFTDYSGLFAGTAELPSISQIKRGKTAYEPVLLGMTSLHGRHKWLRKAKLV